MTGTAKSADKLHGRLNRASEVVGSLLVDGFHYLALFAIGGAIVWSAGQAFIGMTAKGGASIEDILLLFIYLELGAMVGIYVAMTALTRMLLADIQAHHRPDTGILMISGGILLLALATLVIRYGSARFPSPRSDGSP
jgi:phosphate starvation-inducible membrane PsiE